MNSELATLFSENHTLYCIYLAFIASYVWLYV